MSALIVLLGLCGLLVEPKKENIGQTDLTIGGLRVLSIVLIILGTFFIFCDAIA